MNILQTLMDKMFMSVFLFLGHTRLVSSEGGKPIAT